MFFKLVEIPQNRYRNFARLYSIFKFKHSIAKCNIFSINTLSFSNKIRSFGTYVIFKVYEKPNGNKIRKLRGKMYTIRSEILEKKN